MALHGTDNVITNENFETLKKLVPGLTQELTNDTAVGLYLIAINNGNEPKVRENAVRLLANSTNNIAKMVVSDYTTAATIVTQELPEDLCKYLWKNARKGLLCDIAQLRSTFWINRSVDISDRIRIHNSLVKLLDIGDKEVADISAGNISAEWDPKTADSIRAAEEAAARVETPSPTRAAGTPAPTEAFTLPEVNPNDSYNILGMTISKKTAKTVGYCAVGAVVVGAAIYFGKEYYASGTGGTEEFSASGY